MLSSLKKHWREFKASKPGERFQDMHERHGRAGHRAAGVRRYLLIGLGVVLSLAGVLLLPVPGPGSLVIFVGVLMIARESLIVARMLDRLELMLRPAFLRVRRHWRRLRRRP
jgi:hypothetical protein